MSSPTKLHLAEELLLVALDDESGTPLPLPTFSLETALAAAVVMELSLAGRLDSDPEALIVLSDAPTGDALLDDILARITASPERRTTAQWLHVLSAPGGPLVDQVTQRLVQRGILRVEEKRLLWVFRTRTYPPTSGIEEREVKSRVMTLLNNDAIPDSRDTLLIGLLRASGLFEVLLSRSELHRLEPRIAAITQLEEMNRALEHTITELQVLLASARMPLA